MFCIWYNLLKITSSSVLYVGRKVTERCQDTVRLELCVSSKGKESQIAEKHVERSPEGHSGTPKVRSVIQILQHVRVYTASIYCQTVHRTIGKCFRLVRFQTTKRPSRISI